MNLTENRGWTQVLRKDKLSSTSRTRRVILATNPVILYFVNKGPDCDYEKLNMSTLQHILLLKTYY